MWYYTVTTIKLHGKQGSKEYIWNTYQVIHIRKRSSEIQ